MGGVSRRSFFAVSVGGLTALQSHRGALAALPSDTIGLSQGANFAYANALNFKLFLKNKETLGLVGLVSLRPVEGGLGGYADGNLILFPFKLGAYSPEAQAFLPGRSAAKPLIATVPMTPGGLPPDEYLCHYVLNVRPQNFLSYSVGLPFSHGAAKREWHTIVDNIGGHSIGIGWTSANMNHPWFAGSRWIPDRDDGKHWRARIIEGLRQLSAFGGAVG
jgi:hypothetical protein